MRTVLDDSVDRPRRYRSVGLGGRSLVAQLPGRPSVAAAYLGRSGIRIFALPLPHPSETSAAGLYSSGSE